MFLDEEIAKRIGKKGSENSIVYYNGVYNGERITAVLPSSMEEKFYAVAECLLVSDLAVVSTKKVDRLFGEVAVGCALSKKHVLFTDDNDVSAMLKGISLENPEVISENRISEAIATYKTAQGGACRIDIDKAFPVSGIGTVVLGIVTRGAVKVHDRLYLTNGTEAIVRSIQSNDIDVQEAGRGTRVGLALKGIKPEDVRKGDVLVPEKPEPKRFVSGELKTIGFEREEIGEGSAYGFVSNFAYTDAVVRSFSNGKIELGFERDIFAEPGDEFLLIRNRSPRIFAAGRIS